MPASVNLRAQWSNELFELASNFCLYANTSLHDALSTSASIADQFFKSAAFKDKQKSFDSEVKIQVAVVNRLNSVIQAICSLGKLFADRKT